MLLPAAAGTGTYLLTYTRLYLPTSTHSLLPLPPRLCCCSAALLLLLSLFTAASATAVAAAVDGRGTHSRYLT